MYNLMDGDRDLRTCIYVGLSVSREQQSRHLEHQELGVHSNTDLIDIQGFIQRGASWGFPSPLRIYGYK